MVEEKEEEEKAVVGDGMVCHVVTAPWRKPNEEAMRRNR